MSKRIDLLSKIVSIRTEMREILCKRATTGDSTACNSLRKMRREVARIMTILRNGGDGEA